MIGADEVHLWLASPEFIQDPDVLARQLAALSSEEQARLARFVFERDRHRFLVSHALVRDVLSFYAPHVRPAAWRFETNEHGKPRVAAGPEQWLHFNLSHSAGRAVVAVARDRELGVDIEAIRPQYEGLDLARRFFSDLEIANLQADPDRFFDVWTLKEAYIKARGLGLSLPLNSFSVLFDEEGAPGLVVHSHGDQREGGWLLKHWRKEGYSIALAAAHAKTDTHLRVSIGQHVPMGSDPLTRPQY